MTSLLLASALLFAPVKAEEVPQETEKTYTVEEVKEIVSEKLDEAKKWVEQQTILGYSVAGLIAAAPSILLALYNIRQRIKERKDVKEMKEVVLTEWQGIKTEAVNKIETFKGDLIEYKEDVKKPVVCFKEEANNCLKEIVSNTKVIQDAVFNIEKYGEINRVVNTTALMLKELANTPTYVKAGITEKINKLYVEGN